MNRIHHFFHNRYRKVAKILVLLTVLAVQVNGQRLVHSEDGVSFYIDAKLSRSWINASGEQRYYWDVFLTLRNDTPREVYIGRAFAIMPIQCWKIDGLVCDNGMAQGWLSGVRVQPNSIETYQSCWTSVCDYVTPGWDIGAIRFLGNPNPQPTPPPQKTPPTTYPPKGYRYGDPIDRSPTKPSYDDTQQKQREEAQRRQEEQRRKEEEKRQQEESTRLRKQTLFNDYLLKGLDYENEEKYSAARSQYNLAMTYAQNEAEKREVTTRLNSIDRAEKDKIQADKAEQQRLQLEAEKARLEEVKRRNAEIYNNKMREYEQIQKQNEEMVNSLQPLIEDIINLEIAPLSESNEIGVISGNYLHLLSPFVISSQTSTLNEGERRPSGNITSGYLKKKGLSFFFSFDFLELKNSNFKFNALTTSGNRANFSGTLEASSIQFSFQIGKDFRTKNNKLHLFIGPSISYFDLISHKYSYGSGLSKEFKQDGIKWQLSSGLDSKIFVFITNGIGITISYGVSVLTKKPDTSLNYYPYNFDYVRAGLFFRLL